MSWPDGVPRPSVLLRDLLMGKLAWDDAPESIRSCASKHIYDAAETIIAMPVKGERRNAIGRIPGAMRGHVEAEIKRLWSLRGV